MVYREGGLVKTRPHPNPKDKLDTVRQKMGMMEQAEILTSEEEAIVDNVSDKRAFTKSKVRFDKFGLKIEDIYPTKLNKTLLFARRFEFRTSWGIWYYEQPKVYISKWSSNGSQEVVKPSSLLGKVIRHLSCYSRKNNYGKTNL